MWRVLAALAPVIGAAIRGAQKRIQRDLRRAHADSPARAVAIAQRSPLVCWQLARLTRAGVVRSVAGESYYWHEESWQAYRRTRRRRALTVVSVMLVIVVFLWLHGMFR